jgi:hypothetical protein
VKKCTSCTKDLPDAALHCVFCGAKQPPAPAVQQGLAKTAFGYSANDMLDQIRQQGVPQPRAQPPSQPPPRAVPTPQPQQPPPPSPFNPPPYNPPRAMPPQPPQPPQPIAPPQVPPPRFPAPPIAHGPHQGGPHQGGPYQGGPQGPVPSNPHAGPQGGYVPSSPAGAPTMFAQSGPASPQPPQPAMLQTPQPPAYGRPPPPSAMQPTLIPPPSAMQPTQISPQTPAQPPIMRIPVPMPQPYISSPDAHMSRPIEPWRDSLRMMMFIWGVALLVAFATPLTTKPGLTFSWDLVLKGAGTARLPPLMIAAVGLLSVLVAAIPMQSGARGMIAALLGLAGIAVPIALVGAPPWQALCSMIGALVLVPALLVREEYRYPALPRILVTIGAVGILLPFLLPQGGAIPLVAVFKGLFEQPGLGKVEPALALALIIIVVMSLLAWLPAPVSGGAKVWAWLVILWALIVHVTHLVVAGNLGDVVKASPNAALVPWIAGGSAFSIGSAYLALVGYGLASVVGKQLE